MSLTACLSGPESTRAKAELALEDAVIPIVPDGHYSLMDWASKLPPLPSGEKPKAPHGFLCIQVRDADQLNQAVSVVEKAKWVLRVHHETLPEPEPDPVTATLEQMRAEIAELRAEVNRGV